MTWTCDYLAACKIPNWSLIPVSPAAFNQQSHAHPESSESRSEGHKKDRRVQWDSPRIWAYAHAAPLGGDHTTARSGTMRRRTLRWMLARAESVDEVPLYEPKGEKVRVLGDV